MRDDALLAAGQSHWCATGWYRIALPWTDGADPDPRLLLEADAGDGTTPGLQVFPMALSGSRAEAILALREGHYRLHVAGAPAGATPAITPLARGQALAAMWSALGGGLAARAAALWRILPGARRGAAGMAGALVLEYRRRLALAGHSRLGRDTVPYRHGGRDDALLRHPASDPRRLPAVNSPFHERPQHGWLLRPPVPGQPVAAGWHRLRLSCRAVDGEVRPLMLQPDFGRGPEPTAGVFLGDDGHRGEWDLLVMFPEPAEALWLRPAWHDAELSLASMQLVQVGRVRALWSMLRGVTRGGSFVGEAWRFAREARAGGLSAAADALLRRYQQRHDIGLDPYAAWVRYFDSFRDEDLARQREDAAALGPGPTFSILVPVYNTPEHWLRRCIDSVLEQAWPHWQLCLADDASPDPTVGRVLAEYAARDPRIQVVRRARNGHISEASNSALELATGDYVALLDHDDELRPHALLEMAKAIVADPRLEMLYSDEDKLDGDGRRFDPYFKPDWDPDLLRSQNYLCHLSVIRTALVRAVGGFRTGYEGSQDHDLVLRCSERVDPARIRHIPRVLYHWRAIEGSTALVRDAKDYAAAAGERAVAAQLERCHPDAHVEGLSHGHYRVRWPLPQPAPKVSLLVPTRDRVELLRTCVESVLERTDYPDFEIVVVDNQSSDHEALAYLNALQSRPRVRVLRYDAPFNYSAINNWAASQSDGALLCLLNNDVEVISPDWLTEMATQALRPEIGAVGAMLYYPDDSIQHAGVILGIHGVAAHAYAGMPRGYPGHGGRVRVVQRLSAVTAACLLVRRAVFEQVGGLDESLRVAFNDIDFCLRVREAGYHNLWTPFAELYHHESASRGSEDTPEKRARFIGEVEAMQRRWGARLLDDPAWNPNLSLTSLNAEYAFPPRL